MNLRPYQKEAVGKIMAAYRENRTRLATVCIPTGFGVLRILAECIRKALQENADSKILCLFGQKAEVTQFEEMMGEEGIGVSKFGNADDLFSRSVWCTTYAAYPRSGGLRFDLTVCVHAEKLDREKDRELLSAESRLTLGVFSAQPRDENNLFFHAPCLFALNGVDGSEAYFIEQAAEPILRHMGFQEIQFMSSVGNDTRPDIAAIKDGITYFIEIKTYRGIHNDRHNIWRAAGIVSSFKSVLQADRPNSRFGLIVTCDVGEREKREIVKDYGIFLWDIKNLLYICSGDRELTDLLGRIAPFSLNEVKAEKPIEVDYAAKPKMTVESEKKREDELIEKLRACKTGRAGNADQEYEKICAEIIKYLFDKEFSQFVEQHSTKDKMFRMDIICGLKGTAAFWDFLIRFYNTKFVVFECKNYTAKIEQNLIYVTDKYLFNPALRNVAFIVSRKGFDGSAQNAAMGILKEQGKLILDLTDSDLEIMLKAKSEGKEPSDHLLDKVEKLLMSVSI